MTIKPRNNIQLIVCHFENKTENLKCSLVTISLIIKKSDVYVYLLFAETLNRF